MDADQAALTDLLFQDDGPSLGQLKASPIGSVMLKTDISGTSGRTVDANLVRFPRKVAESF